MKLTRTEQIWIKGDEILSNLCHLSKNLYNEANYTIRQELFETGKWIRDLSILKESENYKALPAQTAQQILRIVDRNWFSFFGAIKEWKVHPEKFYTKPKIPHYKKKDGEFVVVFTNQQAKLKDGWLIVLPRLLGLKIKTRIKEGLRQVRIIPKGVGYVLEIVYQKVIKVKERNKDRVVGIDIGVRNFITMVNNIGETPIVVKGGVAKSINQFYNKEKGRIQSVYDLQGIKYGSKIQKLSVKREQKLNDFFHKISRFVVNWCVKHNIGTIVVGHNNNWKQKVNIGRKNNQNFVQIPFGKLIQQIDYKAEEKGIELREQEESHTSKCSFLDDEFVGHHNTYMGKRVKRGIFRTAKGILINADVNAGYNIIKKAILKAFDKCMDGIEGVALHPLRYSITDKKINKPNSIVY